MEGDIIKKKEILEIIEKEMLDNIEFDIHLKYEKEKLYFIEIEKDC